MTKTSKADELHNIMENREAWALKAFSLIEEKVFHNEARLPDIRIGFGMTTQGRRGKMLGETWQGEASADGVIEMTVRMDVADPLRLLAVLCHQKICTSVPIDVEERLEEIKRKATKCGLILSRKPPRPNDLLLVTLMEIAAELGPFPGAELDIEYRAISDARKQSTRGRKAQCPQCASPLRISTKAATIGLPFCDRHWQRLVLEDPQPGDPPPKPCPPVPDGWALEPPDVVLSKKNGRLKALPVESTKSDRTSLPVVEHEDIVRETSDSRALTPNKMISLPLGTGDEPPVQDDLLSGLAASVGVGQDHSEPLSELFNWEGTFPFGTHVPTEVKVAIRSYGGHFNERKEVWHGSCSGKTADEIEQLVVAAKGRFIKAAATTNAGNVRPEAAE